jgi:hypothetical protein
MKISIELQIWISIILIKPEAILGLFLLFLLVFVRENVIIRILLFCIVLPLIFVLSLVSLNLLIEQLIIILLLAPLRRLMIILVPLLIGFLFHLALLILRLVLLSVLNIASTSFLEGDGRRLQCLKRFPEVPEATGDVALGCCIK